MKDRKVTTSTTADKFRILHKVAAFLGTYSFDRMTKRCRWFLLEMSLWRIAKSQSDYLHDIFNTELVIKSMFSVAGYPT